MATNQDVVDVLKRIEELIALWLDENMATAMQKRRGRP